MFSDSTTSIRSAVMVISMLGLVGVGFFFVLIPYRRLRQEDLTKKDQNPQNTLIVGVSPYFYKKRKYKDVNLRLRLHEGCVKN